MLSLMLTVEMEAASVLRVEDDMIFNIANGNSQALHELYEIIHKSVYGFALSITKNTHDAEDILQDTLISIHNKASTYVPEGKPMAWIFTIAKNHALQLLRKQSKYTDVEEYQFENSLPFQKIEDVEQRLVLQAAMNGLLEEERQILMLHAVGGLKHREIANVLQISLNTELSKYHRTIKKMKKMLKEAEVD